MVINFGEDNSPLEQLPLQTSNKTVKKYLPPCTVDNVPHSSACTPRETEEYQGAPDLQRLLKQQQLETARLLASAFEKLEMPKQEIFTFDGNPRKVSILGS